MHCFRTILSNPIVTSIDSNERDNQVQSLFQIFLLFNENFGASLVVSNILQMNGSKKNKPVVTRPPPPIPQAPPTISSDLLLIDFSDLSSAKTSSSLEKSQQSRSSHQPSLPSSIPTPPPLPPPPTTTTVATEYVRRSPQIPRRFSNRAIDSQQFVAQVVSGVTEQLKNDFPQLNSSSSSSKQYTPPLVRRFTVPYPSTYYNTQRPQ